MTDLTPKEALAKVGARINHDFGGHNAFAGFVLQVLDELGLMVVKKDFGQENLTALSLELMDEVSAKKALAEMGIHDWSASMNESWVKDINEMALYVARDGKEYHYGVEEFHDGKNRILAAGDAKCFLHGIQQAERDYEKVKGEGR